eukprot:794889-Amphidinium_carterae.1
MVRAWQGEAAVCAGSRSVPEEHASQHEPETSCARTLTHYDVAVHPAVQGDAVSREILRGVFVIAWGCRCVCSYI